ncbi:hypothetical protein SAMN04487970_102424 [Paenibacillus tianmuensis]|uniref:Uncharacterized protein n=1 Tax=Paenibacillus tianmuensis TaxID=624147 RepID=A0A1G4S725_9BACL|nr:hypothetical protein [Paenibacillus tianmuensis]SCW65003.1 hypothetical protein SAMN04487970_102424 [Paenibacillus tianmuensis]
MTEEEAKRLLMLHSFSIDEAIDHPKGQTGFLMSLRPYRGLIEENFHEIMYALSILQKKLGPETPHLDRDLVTAVWGMCHLSRAWGVHSDGMLRSNDLIVEEDVCRLEEWIETISYAFLNLLEGNGDEAFFEYLESYGAFREPKLEEEG